MKDGLQDKLVANIEALRVAYPGSASSSIAHKEDVKRRESASGFSTVGVSQPIGETNYRFTPLTKETLDLMDAPIPSGVLAEEFAYHGLAPSFLREMHQAQELLDQICSELREYVH